jgi:hypothetical protein
LPRRKTKKELEKVKIELSFIESILMFDFRLARKRVSSEMKWMFVWLFLSDFLQISISPVYVFGITQQAVDICLGSFRIPLAFNQRVDEALRLSDHGK